jgi:ribosome-binding factor A
MSLRGEKVSSAIKRIVAEKVRLMGQDSGAGIVSVTSVKVSADLQIARIYISVFAGQKGKNSDKINGREFIKFVEGQQGEMRRLIGKGLRLRRVPELKFFIDDTLDEIERIKALTEKVTQMNTIEKTKSKGSR